MTYSEKLKDPRWQKARLKVLERDGWSCQFCGETDDMLVVHHVEYQKDKEPWEYEQEYLVTLCESCHEQERSCREEYEQLLLHTLRITHVQADDLFSLVEVFCHGHKGASALESSLRIFALRDLSMTGKMDGLVKEVFEASTKSKKKSFDKRMKANDKTLKQS